MDPIIIMQMILAGVLGAILYTIIGIAPGTDETAVLAPVTIALALLGLSPHVILAFFISAIVAKKINGLHPCCYSGNTRRCHGCSHGRACHGTETAWVSRCKYSKNGIWICNRHTCLHSSQFTDCLFDFTRCRYGSSVFWINFHIRSDFFSITDTK